MWHDLPPWNSRVLYVTSISIAYVHEIWHSLTEQERIHHVISARPETRESTTFCIMTSTQCSKAYPTFQAQFSKAFWGWIETGNFQHLLAYSCYCFSWGICVQLHRPHYCLGLHQTRPSLCHSKLSHRTQLLSCFWGKTSQVPKNQFRVCC